MTIDKMLMMEKEQIPEEAKNLTSGDLRFLVDLLSEKDDKLRYTALLLLQGRSVTTSDVYPYWDVFLQKLKSENSYQRSIGLTLIAENVKWDTENKMDNTLDDFLKHIHDEKPITARQCIQSLQKVVSFKHHLAGRTADALMAVDIAKVRETMQKSILTDILGVIAVIRRLQPADKIEEYIMKALTGDILDKKTKKELEKKLAE